MKIRSGFVSNSSSSSFLIYGVCLDEDEIREALNIDDDVDIYGILEDKLENADMEYHNPEYYDGWFIGKSWSDVGDDETGKQFKTTIENKLTEVFGEGLDFGTHEEAWRDG